MTEINMLDVVGEYDTPDSVPEWAWVEKNASFSCLQNGQSGVWDFQINLSREFNDVPEKLQPVIEQAKSEGYSYILFHQGT